MPSQKLFGRKANQLMVSTLLAHSQIVPPFVRRLLRSGSLPLSLSAIYDEGPETVCVSEGCGADVDVDLVRGGVDAAILSFGSWDPARLLSALEKMRTAVNPDGRVTVLYAGADKSPLTMSQWDLFLSDQSWIRYQQGALTASDDPLQVWGIVLVLKTYNPVQHARRIVDQGRPDLAIAPLKDIPESLITSNTTQALLALEKQRLYLKWQQQLHGQLPSHAFFSKERREFAQVTTVSPLLKESYHVHSRFWSHIGRDDMAIRTLSSIDHVCPDETTRHLLQLLRHRMLTPAKACRLEQALADWQMEWRPRILFITHGTSDYGQDTLYHGLCTLLGHENVVDYPWKPTLHGREVDTANSYPCVFNYPGEPLSVDDLVVQLQTGGFDFILFSDLLGMIHQQEVRRLVNAAPHLPVVLYDAWDDCYTPLHTVLEYLDRSEVALVFKREMLDGVDYGTRTYPLPFGYPETLSCAGLPVDQRASDAPFWAGRNEFGLRSLYVQQLERITGCDMQTRFDQDTYRERLRSSLIGLSFFGVGFDTVRYWEIPANGVMLLAENPPIIIPNNFEDGISAVFFENMSELESKLDYYTKHPDEAARIAVNGHHHYVKYHTTTARARYVLGTVYQQLFNQHNGQLVAGK